MSGLTASLDAARRRPPRLAAESRVLADVAAFVAPTLSPNGAGVTVDGRPTLFAEWVEWRTAGERAYLFFPGQSPARPRRAGD